VLVLDYLRRARRITPEIEMKAVEYVNLGYQRLLNFEVPGGGFEWYGKAPADVVLSAYGLVQFADMAKVYEIDPRVIARTQKFLVGQQNPDGSWLKGQYIATAYIAWALAESGDRGVALTAALRWLKDHLDDAPNAYAMALAANALLEVDRNDAEGRAILKSMVDRMREGALESEGETLTYARGPSAAIETTALAALAMLKTPDYPEPVSRALEWIVKKKDARGTWGSTSATILALKALIRGLGGLEQKGLVKIAISVNGERRVLEVAPDQADVMQIADFAGATRRGANEVTIEVEGESNMTYQLLARHYVAWGNERAAEPPISIDVTYDRAKLSTDDVLTANVLMRYRGAQETFMILMDLGIPPGFTLDPGAFEKLVETGRIDKFSATARQVTLYFGKVKPGAEERFSYTLIPKYPIKAKTPKSQVWEYYNPERRAEARPILIEVVK
jgi:hypothetical protein